MGPYPDLDGVHAALHRIHRRTNALMFPPGRRPGEIGPATLNDALELSRLFEAERRLVRCMNRRWATTHPGLPPMPVLA